MTYVFEMELTQSQLWSDWFERNSKVIGTDRWKLITGGYESNNT